MDIKSGRLINVNRMTCMNEAAEKMNSKTKSF